VVCVVGGGSHRKEYEMNERIRELAINAGMIRMNQRSDGLYVVGEEVFDNFAELIIKKCIQAASDPGDGLIKANTWHDGVRACIWSIQDEFDLDRSFGVWP
jgi:hypothetical protein